MQRLMALFASLAAIICSAATHYVVPPGTPGVNPANPFTNGWEYAATNIQDAINAAEAGNTILVSTGTYMLAGDILITKSINLRSWNNGAVDREKTVLDANNYTGKPVTNRCLYIINAMDVAIRGFTMTNGSAYSGTHERGGAVYIYTGCSVTLDDCQVAGNRARENGGGLFSYSPVIITNCHFMGNTVSGECAGAISVHDGLISDCIVEKNTGALAGGISLRAGPGSVVRRTAIVSNTVISDTFPRAGGVYSLNGVIENCTIIGNTIVGLSSGAAVIFREGATNILRNCLVANNISARRGSGLYIYRGTAIVENCTIVSNRATAAAVDGAGVFAIHSATGQMFSLVNCIVYDNDNGVNANSNFYFQTVQAGYVSNTCIAPIPAVANVSVTYSTASDPLFQSAAAGDFRLQPGSPGVNAGVYIEGWMPGAKDLDGLSRIDRFSGLVDMGCFEYIPQGAMYLLR